MHTAVYVIRIQEIYYGCVQFSWLFGQIRYETINRHLLNMNAKTQSPIQKILFGNPGTGKSYKIVNEIIPDLGINVSENPENVIKTVFHPEYTYGDFMGKLVPITRKEKVQYNFFEGHFLKALGQSYKNIQKQYSTDLQKVIWEKVKNTALVIDEINRGNSSAIFGVCFQLLDRNEDGWSSYSINLTEIEFYKLIELIGVKIDVLNGELKFKFPGEGHHVQYDSLKHKFAPLGINTETKAIKIPPNLSIIGTMNTSDNSIYFMDSAFKRRWDWEFIDWDENNQIPLPEYGDGFKHDYGFLSQEEWKELVKGVNIFLKENHTAIRGIEDKQIGYYFIKDYPVSSEKIRNKLMFFLWDSVFNRDQKPLIELLEVSKEQLITFGDFCKYHNVFINKLTNKYKLNIKNKSISSIHLRNNTRILDVIKKN